MESIRRDVWTVPSIGPTAAVVLTLLLGLVWWLTVTYAPEAAARGALPYGEDPSGVISPSWGWATVIAMTVLAFVAGFEPIIRRALEAWWNRLTFERKLTVATLTVWIWLPAKLLSLLWSGADLFLVRCVAFLAGTAFRGLVKRYGVFLAWMAAVIAGALMVQPIWGPWIVLGGLLMIIGVAFAAGTGSRPTARRSSSSAGGAPPAGTKKANFPLLTYEIGHVRQTRIRSTREPDRPQPSDCQRSLHRRGYRAI